MAPVYDRKYKKMNKDQHQKLKDSRQFKLSVSYVKD